MDKVLGGLIVLCSIGASLAIPVLIVVALIKFIGS